MEYGLLHNLALWPNPPTSWLWMKIKRLQYTNRRKQMIAARAAAADAYTVQRRRCCTGLMSNPWQDIHTAVATETVLDDQPTSETLEYRIIAVNKAGEGEPSNTEMVVL